MLVKKKKKGRTAGGNISRNTVNQGTTIFMIARSKVMEEITGGINNPRGRTITDPTPIMFPDDFDIRDRPGATGSKPPLHAVQRTTPRQLCIDAVERCRAVLCEPDG